MLISILFNLILLCRFFLVHIRFRNFQATFCMIQANILFTTFLHQSLNYNLIAKIRRQLTATNAKTVFCVENSWLFWAWWWNTCLTHGDISWIARIRINWNGCCVGFSHFIHFLVYSTAFSSKQLIIFHPFNKWGLPR